MSVAVPIAHRHAPYNPFVVVAITLTLAIVAALLRLTILPAIEARFGIFSHPSVVYALIDGYFTRLDPSTGAILAQSPDLTGDQFSSVAASHDGQSVFVLHTVPKDDSFADELLTLSAATLSVKARAPVQHFMRPMDSWPPALAVSVDDRTVIVSQYGNTESDPYWLSYYDRQTGRFAPDSTVLDGCGVAQLLPFDQQVAVLCFGSDNLRFVDLRTHRVMATMTPGLTPTGVLGSAVAAGLIPGQQALAVVLDLGSLVRVDLRTHAISVITNLASPTGDLAPRWADFNASGRVVVLLERVDGAETRPLPLLIVDTASGRIVDRETVDSLYPTLTMSPDGQRVYVLAGAGSLQEIDLTTHRMQPFGPDPAHTSGHVLFSAR
jgi:hypothetical protein